jgi:signal transduction histidine kinase
MAKLLQTHSRAPATEDREALEHIARALAKPHDDADLPRKAKALILDEKTVASLLNALPAALGILCGGRLEHGNPAFANAFGYRSFEELSGAGGLAAIVPGGLAKAETVMTAGRRPSSHLKVDATTRGKRQIKVNFEISPLASDGSLQLLRLIDQTGLAASHGVAPAAAKPGGGAEAANAPTPAAGAAAGAEAAAGPAAIPAEQQLNFLAKISHEVRTPLNSILGFTELMIGERLGPIGNDRYKGYIEDIRQSGLYALSLLNDLLDLSKIEAGKFELDFAAVDVGETVHDCVHLLQPLAKRERILLRVSLQAHLPAVVADQRRLKQILLNLLSNAIKFTRAGGQVIVSGQTLPDGTLRLRVSDNGVGMSKAEIRLAMQPFQQLETTPRHQTGTGLGLPLTKALIEASRARFVLNSESGAGTSADIVFPKDRLVPQTSKSSRG